MSKDTWFDAFFRAVTSSPEFKYILEKDRKRDLWNSLKGIEDSIKSASTINDDLKKDFYTKEALDLWNSIDYWDKNKTNHNKQKQDSGFVKYFVNDNPKTWWFKWVAGMKELKRELLEGFIKPLRFKFLVKKLKQDISLKSVKEIDKKKNRLYLELYDAYKKFKVSIPTGLLFYWPPWTWKTFITRKLAEELWAWLIKKSVWEFGSSYIHETSKNIRDFFNKAKQESEKWPIILFLDEIDSLVSSRTKNIDSNKAEEVSEFLQEFNSLWEAEDLIVIAATNRPDHLDSAILRSWRFDKKIYIWEPDLEARKELFQIYIEKQWRPHWKLDYEELAKLTEGYVAADIEAICDEVSRDASDAILDIAQSIDSDSFDEKSIKSKLNNHIITMYLLKQAIKDTNSSLKVVDMSIYDNYKNSLK